MAKAYKAPKSHREMKRLQARQDRKFLMETELSSAEKQKAMLFKNGITLDDMQREYDKGAADGRRFGEDFAFHTIYAVFLITMIDHYGMDQEKAIELLRYMDKQVMLCVADDELTKETYERTGIEIDWRDPIERVTRKDDDLSTD